jgi:hypothetical protein
MKKMNKKLPKLSVESFVVNAKAIRGGVEILDIDFDLRDVTCNCCPPPKQEEQTPVYGPTLD